MRMAIQQGPEETTQKWLQYCLNGQLRVRYSARRKKFVMEVFNRDLAIQADKLGSQEESLSLGNAQKFSFDLTFAMKATMEKSSSQVQLGKQIVKEMSGDQSQLKELMVKLRPNDTLVWENVNQV